MCGCVNSPANREYKSQLTWKPEIIRAPDGNIHATVWCRGTALESGQGPVSCPATAMMEHWKDIETFCQYCGTRESSTSAQHNYKPIRFFSFFFLLQQLCIFIQNLKKPQHLPMFKEGYKVQIQHSYLFQFPINFKARRINLSLVSGKIKRNTSGTSVGSLSPTIH